jgi:hypothetical protein
MSDDHNVVEWTDEHGRRVVRLVESERRILDAVAATGLRRWWRLRKLRASNRNMALILGHARGCLCGGRCPICGDPELRRAGVTVGHPLVPEIKTVDYVAADAFVCSNPDCGHRIPVTHRMEYGA